MDTATTTLAAAVEAADAALSARRRTTHARALEQLRARTTGPELAAAYRRYYDAGGPLGLSCSFRRYVEQLATTGVHP